MGQRLVALLVLVLASALPPACAVAAAQDIPSGASPTPPPHRWSSATRGGRLAGAVGAGGTRTRGNRRALGQRAAEWFDAWNAHSAARLELLLAPGASLVDWDVEAAGAGAVAAANEKIWEALPGVQIEVHALHAAPATNTVTAEITVHLNDGSEPPTLAAVDVLSFTPTMKVQRVSAYKR